MTGFRFLTGARIFLLTTASKQVLRPTQPPTQWVPGLLSPVVKRLEREADCSPSFNADVNE
jgi:hypothetical protein